MTLRERILAVYRGETPDVVPFMLDLSHYFYAKTRLPWDLSKSYEKPEYELIAFHREQGAGFYMPNLGAFYTAENRADVNAKVEKSADGQIITWTYETPLGTISRHRRWEEQTYAWGMLDWAISSEDDLRVLAHALTGRKFAWIPGKYEAWLEAVGDLGVVYVSPGYSAMGQLMNYWLGVEKTIYATMDWNTTMHEVVDAINANNLDLIDVLAQCPAEIIIMGDNFSSDIQPPYFFDEWSRPYYEEAIRRLHAAGKCVAVHIDGKLRGAIAMIRDAGADCGDAITPGSMGGMTPAECRAEAGSDFILSGGVAPDLWLPSVDESTFKAAALEWLELRKESPRLIANVGDQVPPGACEERIHLYRGLVEEHGRY